MILLAQQVLDFERIVVNYGLPTGLLLVVLFGSYRLGRYLIAGHLNYLERTCAAIERHGETLDRINISQDKLHERLDSTCRAVCPVAPTDFRKSRS